MTSAYLYQRQKKETPRRGQLYRVASHPLQNLEMIIFIDNGADVKNNETKRLKFKQSIQLHKYYFFLRIQLLE